MDFKNLSPILNMLGSTGNGMPLLNVFQGLNGSRNFPFGQNQSPPENPPAPVNNAQSGYNTYDDYNMGEKPNYNYRAHSQDFNKSQPPQISKKNTKPEYVPQFNISNGIGAVVSDSGSSVHSQNAQNYASVSPSDYAPVQNTVNTQSVGSQGVPNMNTDSSNNSNNLMNSVIGALKGGGGTGNGMLDLMMNQFQGNSGYGDLFKMLGANKKSSPAVNTTVSKPSESSEIDKLPRV